MHTESTHRRDTSKSEPGTNTAPAGWRLVPVEPTPEMIHALADNVSLMDFKAGAIAGWSAALAAAPQPPAAQQGEAVAWKHDCAALLANDLELWIDRCPHCGKPRAQPAAAPQPVAQGDYAPVSAEQEAATDTALGLVTLPPIRVDRATHAALQEAAKARGLILQALVRERLAPYALAAAPAGVVGEPGGQWDGAEEWMPLAWALCADECGEEACTELVWEGGPIPEPWGDRWLKYEDEAKRLIALVRKHVPAAPPARQALTDEQIRRMWFAAEPKDGRPASWNYARAIERACAEAWGVTLVGIGGKGGAA